jgi:uncharacterized DUF497 family protein
MAWHRIFWDLEPGGNAEHIAEHGVEIEEVEYVLRNPLKRDISRSSGRPMVFGYMPTGEYVAVVFEELDDHTVYPITAYILED